MGRERSGRNDECNEYDTQGTTVRDRGQTASDGGVGTSGRGEMMDRARVEVGQIRPKGGRCGCYISCRVRSFAIQPSIDAAMSINLMDTNAAQPFSYDVDVHCSHFLESIPQIWL